MEQPAVWNRPAPAGGYPAGAYPTGGYPTGAAGGHSSGGYSGGGTGGYPTGGYQPTGWLPPPPTTPPTAQAPVGPPPGRPRRRRAVPAAVAALLVVVAAAAGVGIGHAVWPTSGQQSAGVVDSRSNAGAPATNGGTDSGPITTPSGPSSAGSAGSGGSSGSSGSSGGSGSSGSSGATSSPGTDGADGSGTSGSSEAPGSSGSSGSGGTGSGGLDNGSGGTGSGGLGNGGLGDGSSGQSSTGTGSAALDKVVAGVDGALVDINVQFSYQQAEGAGTGIVLTSTGEILTNNHVIDGATAISVVDIGNGKTYGATVVGYDVTDDIAVLQLKGASGLQTAKIGDSSKLSVGDTVVGIGNAGGTGGTPSAAAGSVTALNQKITVSDELYGTTTTLAGLIEVNADIQSGDSGGSLINASGQVVGVDTAASAGYSSRVSGGDGFAVPITTAMQIARQIETGKGTSTVHVGTTAALGVLISSADSGSTGSGQGNLGGQGGQGGSATAGAPVVGVVPGGAAAGAGLVVGDVITSLDGHAVASSAALSTLMAAEHTGAKVSLGWADASGAAHTATVTLGSGPAA